MLGKQVSSSPMNCGEDEVTVIPAAVCSEGKQVSSSPINLGELVSAAVKSSLFSSQLDVEDDRVPEVSTFRCDTAGRQTGT